MDKREMIIARLVEICRAQNVKTYRNQIDIPETEHAKGVAVVILEGDEEVDPASFERGRPADGPQIVESLPQIHLIAMDEPERVGPKLNQLRRQILKAVFSDTALIAMAHKGSIKYRGMRTGIAGGRGVLVEAYLTFAIPYVLRPRDL